MVSVPLLMNEELILREHYIIHHELTNEYLVSYLTNFLR